MLNAVRTRQESLRTESTTSLPGTLGAGVLVPPGIYVVSHFTPIHTTPHEILITTWTILPTCNLCHGVRFSFKCTPTEKLEENEFFGPDSMVLAAHLRSDAEEVRRLIADSRSLLAQSRHFLAGLEETTEKNWVKWLRDWRPSPSK